MGPCVRLPFGRAWLGDARETKHIAESETKVKRTSSEYGVASNEESSGRVPATPRHSELASRFSLRPKKTSEPSEGGRPARGETDDGRTGSNASALTSGVRQQ